MSLAVRKERNCVHNLGRKHNEYPPLENITFFFSSPIKNVIISTMKLKLVSGEVLSSLRRESSWLVPALVLLALFLFHRPADRFEATESQQIALDRKTGQLCYTTATDGADLPLCSDLAKWWHW
jgi:hypothetical protein